MSKILQGLLFTLIITFVILYACLIAQASTLIMRLCMLLFFILVCVCLYYESKTLGCTFSDCSLERNRATLNRSMAKMPSFACQESVRVNWRRANIIAFGLFVVLTILWTQDEAKNMIVYLLLWVILYFYFNFDQYHRSTLACQDAG